MQVRDVMTVAVISVAPATPVKEIAQTLVGARIGGVPVLEEGRLVGIVTSSDVLAVKERSGEASPTAADVMTGKPRTLTEGTSVAAAARVLARYRIKRAPVVRGSKVVGIITRGDLLRPYLRTDWEILAEVEDEVLGRTLGLSPRKVRVEVRGGAVRLSGEIASDELRALAVRLVRAAAGVVGVEDALEVVPRARVAAR